MYWKINDRQLVISDNLTLEVAGDVGDANLVGLDGYTDYLIVVGIWGKMLRGKCC